MSANPTLQWNPVPGVSKYLVILRGDGLEWTTEVTDTKIKYEGQQPLKPGVQYSLFVRADNGNTSRMEEVTGIGFSLLPIDDVGRLKADIGRRKM